MSPKLAFRSRLFALRTTIMVEFAGDYLQNAEAHHLHLNIMYCIVCLSMLNVCAAVQSCIVLQYMTGNHNCHVHSQSVTIWFEL